MAGQRVLVVVSADPDTSHRANEAIRIALGILAGEHELTLVLLGPAAKVLGPGAEDAVDGDDLVRHLGTLRKLGQPFHVARDAIPSSPGWNAGGATVVPVSADELADLVARADRVLVF